MRCVTLTVGPAYDEEIFGIFLDEHDCLTARYFRSQFEEWMAFAEYGPEHKLDAERLAAFVRFMQDRTPGLRFFPAGGLEDFWPEFYGPMKETLEYLEFKEKRSDG